MLKNQEFTYIGKSTNLKGNFTFKGPTHLQGQIQGEMHVEEAAKLVLEIGSITDGTLHCYDLDIYGQFTGEINSKGRVTIFPTAYFEGKILSQSLEILPRAIVNMNAHTEEKIPT